MSRTIEATSCSNCAGVILLGHRTDAPSPAQPSFYFILLLLYDVMITSLEYVSIETMSILLNSRRVLTSPWNYFGVESRPRCTDRCWPATDGPGPQQSLGESMTLTRWPRPAPQQLNPALPYRDNARTAGRSATHRSRASLASGANVTPEAYGPITLSHLCASAVIRFVQRRNDPRENCE